MKVVFKKVPFLAALSVLATTGMALTVLPAFANGSRGLYSLRSYNLSEYYISHNNFLGYIEIPNTEVKKRDATYRLRNGLANSNCTSFESVNFPGRFLRHQDFRVKLHRNDGSRLFREDATFCQRQGVAGSGRSFESHNLPGYFIRHKNFELLVEPSDGSDLFREDATFIVDDPLHTSTSR